MREQMVVETEWVELAEGRGIQLAEDFAQMSELSVMDITGQPAVNIVPEPNMFFVLVWGTSEQLDIIAADPRYVDRVVPGTREVLDGEETA